MDREAECEIARSTGSAVTDRDGESPSASGPTTPVRATSVRAVLLTRDGVRIEAEHLPYAGEGEAPDGALVLAHGFTGSLQKPALRRAAETFAQHAPVIVFSFRGHGGSGGRSTLGDREVLDLAAAVRWARSLGHRRIVTVGFSMGGSVVLRHGGLYGAGRAADEGTDGGEADSRTPPGDGEFPSVRSSEGTVHRGRTGAHAVPERPGHPADGSPEQALTRNGARDLAAYAAHPDAVVAVSAPARWFYRGTAPMRRLHWVVERRLGRAVGRYGLRTRIDSRSWDPVPLSPVAAAPLIAPAPLLVVHGDRDPYFPLDHPLSLAEAAGPDGAELWVEGGFGHAENAAAPPLLHRIGSWARSRSLTVGAARHHGTRNADG